MATASDSSGSSTPSSQGPGTPEASPSQTSTPLASAPASPSSQPSGTPGKCGSHAGPKFKLINEGDIQLCRLNHTRTIVSKIMNSKYLRRWEAHHLILADSEILSSTVSTSVQMHHSFHMMMQQVGLDSNERRMFSFKCQQHSCQDMKFGVLQQVYTWMTLLEMQYPVSLPSQVQLKTVQCLSWTQTSTSRTSTIYHQTLSARHQLSPVRHQLADANCECLRSVCIWQCQRSVPRFFRSLWA